MTRQFRLLLAPLLVAMMMAVPAAAQDDDPDRDPNDSQPDFYVATLHTNLRLPKGKFNFRLTHRFTTPLGQGDVGDLAERLSQVAELSDEEVERLIAQKLS